MVRDIKLNARYVKTVFFSKTNLIIEEVLKFTYWWSQDLTQSQIQFQLGLSSRTAVDWDMFC